MNVRYRLINMGRIIQEQVREYDGPPEANKKLIESDMYDGMDPAHMARDGKQVVWIEGVIQ